MRFAGLVILSVFVTILDLATLAALPIITVSMFDIEKLAAYVTPWIDFKLSMTSIVWLGLLVVGVSTIAKISNNYLQLQFLARLTSSVAQKVFSEVLENYSRFEQLYQPVVLARSLFGDIQTWSSEFIGRWFVIVEKIFILMISLILVSFFIPWGLIGAVAILLAAVFLCIKQLHGIMNKKGCIVRDSSDNLFASTVKYLEAADVISFTNSAPQFSRLFERFFYQFSSARADVTFFKLFPSVLVFAVFQMLVVVLPLALVSSDVRIEDAAEWVAMIVVVVTRTLPAFNVLMSEWSAMHSNMAAFARVLDLVDESRSGRLSDVKVDRELDIDEPVAFLLNSVEIGKWGNTALLSHLDCKLYMGEVVGLVGPTGSGKTTFVKTLLGLNPIASGELCISRRLLPLRDNSFYAPQFPVLIPGGWEANIGLYESFDEDRANYLTDILGLKDVRTQLERASKSHSMDWDAILSGGERQRIGLLRALVRKKSFYVFDEPTSSLDAKTSAVVTQQIKSLADFGALVILISHREKDLGWCNRIWHIHGRHLELVEPFK